MFQNIPEIQRLTDSLQQLEKQHKILQSTLRKAKGRSNLIQKQVGNSIEEIIKKAKNKLRLCQQIQREIQNQQFIHGSFLVQDLVQDSTKLPQWFSFVFQKQFDKQRSSFSAIARKLYQQHGLHEKIRQLSNQINAFQNLNKRYQGLNKSQKYCININSDAQSFQNKTALIFSKFINFIQLIGQKIVYFVQQNAQKSINYSDNINNFTKSAKNFQPRQTSFNFIQPQTFQRQQFRDQNHYRSSQKLNNFHTTIPAVSIPSIPSYNDINQRNNRYQGIINNNNQQQQQQRAVSSKRLINNHNYHNHNHNHNQDYYHRSSNFIGNNNDQIYSRFNYRDHAPKWMTAHSIGNNTLSNFYY